MADGRVSGQAIKLKAIMGNDTQPSTEQVMQPDQTGPKPVRIGDLLLEKGLITQEQVDQGLAFQREQKTRKLLGEILIDLKIVSEEQVAECLADTYGLPFVKLTPKLVDPAVAEILPVDYCQKQNVLPMFSVHGKLTLAVAEPTNVFLIEEVERMTGCTVQPVVVIARDVQTTLHARGAASDVFVIDEMIGDVENASIEMVEKEVTDLTNLENAAGDSPVIKLVNYVIYCAVDEGASDIHIEPGDGTLRVRYRVDGRLYEKMQPPVGMQPALVSRIKIMAGLDISERRIPQDGAITVMLNKSPVDLRVSTMPGKFGEKVVMRVIDNSGGAARLADVGFSPKMLERIRHAVAQPNGVVLVTGPTGSGKSTTLYAALNEINDDSVNLSTVEDPVEYNLQGVNQFQVNDKAGFTFSGALRALLRQDPDVVMLGEIRDGETAKIATQAALTGHLVLSTLHTNDAPAAVTRLTNIGVEPFLVAASLRAVIAQRLLRRICTSCKEPVAITAKEKLSLEMLTQGGEPVEQIFHGAGCSKCRQTGYRGRIGVFELFVPDDETLDAIGKGLNLSEIRKLALASDGYMTLQEDGVEKMRQGSTTLEEVLRTVAI